MVVISVVAKGFGDRHLLSDRLSVADIVYLATNYSLLYYTFSNQHKVVIFIVVINNNIHLIIYTKAP
jgi:hypothetical protein